MKENISPEEKLLRLIRGKKHEPATGQIARSGSSGAGSGSYMLSIRKVSIKQALVALFVISWIYLIATFIYSWMGLKNIKLPDVPANAAMEYQAAQVEKVPGARPYESYLQASSGRQIFGSVSGYSQDGGRPAIASGDMIKDISLVAIISGEPPQAAIEDKKAQKTFYVSEGQNIGEFLIEDIQDGKIVLNYKGQKFELYL